MKVLYHLTFRTTVGELICLDDETDDLAAVGGRACTRFNLPANTLRYVRRVPMDSGLFLDPTGHLNEVPAAGATITTTTTTTKPALRGRKEKH